MNTRPTRFVDSLEPRFMLAADLFRDFSPGQVDGMQLNSNPSELTVFAGKLYFATAYTQPSASAFYRAQLWSTDGTQGGTDLVDPTRARVDAGSVALWPTHQARLRYFSGPRSLVVADSRLWYYHIEHISPVVLHVELKSVNSDHQVRKHATWQVNSAEFQQVNDLQVVNGQLYLYRDGLPSAPKVADRKGQWWTVNSTGQLVGTGEEDPGKFLGTGPAKSESAFYHQRMYFSDIGSRGRELYYIKADPEVKLDRGVLWIRGTPENDEVRITRDSGDSSKLRVVLNGSATLWSISQITMIRSELYSGDDLFVMSEENGIITTPASVHGHAGDDTIVTASGRDTLYGGEGNDALYGGDNIDYLWGGFGNDRLNGGGGRDILWGGPGTNTFVSSHAFERRDFDPVKDLLR